MWMMLAGLLIQPPLKPSGSGSISSQRATPAFSSCFAAASKIVGEEFEPDLGLGEHRRLVDPEPVRPELEADLRRLLVIGFEADHVAVEAHRLVELVRTALSWRC